MAVVLTFVQTLRSPLPGFLGCPPESFTNQLHETREPAPLRGAGGSGSTILALRLSPPPSSLLF
jgi:hypothetical protein